MQSEDRGKLGEFLGLVDLGDAEQVTEVAPGGFLHLLCTYQQGNQAQKDVDTAKAGLEIGSLTTASTESTRLCMKGDQPSFGTQTIGDVDQQRRRTALSA